MPQEQPLSRRDTASDTEQLLQRSQQEYTQSEQSDDGEEDGQVQSSHRWYDFAKRAQYRLADGGNQRLYGIAGGAGYPAEDGLDDQCKDEDIEQLMDKIEQGQYHQLRDGIDADRYRLTQSRSVAEAEQFENQQFQQQDSEAEHQRCGVVFLDAGDDTAQGNQQGIGNAHDALRKGVVVIGTNGLHDKAHCDDSCIEVEQNAEYEADCIQCRIGHGG